jgi:hypothetical protein
VQLGGIQETLQAEGVETLAVVIGPAERARLYVRYRPTCLVLLADPEAIVHRAFGLPRPEMAVGETAGSESRWPLRVREEELVALRINPTGELPEPKSPFEASRLLNQRDGYQFTESDKVVVAAHGMQLAGHFLIDREGVIRWTHVEAEDRIEDLVQFPSEAEFLTAARALAGPAQAR